MTFKKPTIIDIEMDKLDEILRRVDSQELSADDCETIRTLLLSYVHLTELLKDKNTKLARLRKLLFGAKTEKTAAVLGTRGPAESPSSPAGDDVASEATQTGDPPANESSTSDTAEEDAAPAPAKGHGRNGADAYTGAERIDVPHDSLQPGDPCPNCDEGTVYQTNRPGVLVRLTGQSPIGAKLYYLQKLRCGLCGKIFKAVGVALPPTIREL